MSIRIASLASLLVACAPEKLPEDNAQAQEETGGDELECFDRPDAPDLIISADDDEDLALLAGTDCIPGRLLLESNVDNLSALSGLKYVGVLEIRAATVLTSLDGLENIEAVEKLIVFENHLLVDLEPLGSLASANEVTISDNPLITDLRGLEGLTWLHRLDVSANDALTSLTGLNNLTELIDPGTEWVLEIVNNQALIDFSGLEALGWIAGGLRIDENTSLTSFDGLESLTAIGGGLRIKDNESLPNCDALTWRETIELDGPVIILDNKPPEGC